MDLYLDKLSQLEKEFRKEAGFSSRLSESAENWPQELTSDLFKQLPYLSDYEVNVNLDRVEAQRGFAFGYADVSNKTERPEVEHAESGMPHIRIPIIVQERMVKPLSVFLDGEKVYPLTEDRVREDLFNPATFDLSTSQPRDPSLVENLMPPHRSGIGMGGEYKMASARLEKTAGPRWDKFVTKWGLTDKMRDTATKRLLGDTSKLPWHKNWKILGAGGLTAGVGIAAATDHNHNSKPVAAAPGPEMPKTSSISLLELIAPTIREKDADRFIDKVASDATLQAGFRRSGIAPTLIDVFDRTKLASAGDRLEALAERIEPTVITFQKLPGGDFFVKSAAVGAFKPGAEAQGQVVPGQEVAQAIGPANAQQMQPGQTATVVSDGVNPEEEDAGNYVQIDQFGEYRVQDLMGNELMGWVFPTVLEWGSFQPQQMAVFTNGSAYAFQDAIAGEFIGASVSLPITKPLGEGVFYSVDRKGAKITAPVNVMGGMSGPDGSPKYSCSDAFGAQFQVSLTPGLSQPMQVMDGEYALPSTWKFMRLNNQTQLVQSPEQMGKTAAVKASNSAVTLWFNGTYNLEGGCGLNKLSSDMRYDISPVDAEFMLGLLGVDGSIAKRKVAEARRYGQVKLAGLKTITLLSERYAEATKTASALARHIPNLRRDLIKEAATLEDEGTVDKVLALNFINPENLSTFVDAIPVLEQTSENLAEMLLSAYVGANQLPEAAIERSMRAMEDVISGLKNIQHAET